jgi:nitroreductase
MAAVIAVLCLILGGSVIELNEVIRRRRMVRQFADDPLPREALERIAAAAQRAPSAGFSQGQRLVIVTEPSRRRRIAEMVGERDYVEAGFGNWISRCGAQFIPLVSEEVYHRRYRETDKVTEEGQEIEWPIPYWWMDIGCTVMLILLAAVNEGLAAGFCGIEDPAGLRAALGMPEEFVPVGVIPVGRPLPDKRSDSLKRGWLRPADFVRWEEWAPPPA